MSSGVNESRVFEQPPKARAMRAIRELLDSSDARSGEPLPSERVLALRLGVSRVTIRGALQALQAAGVLQGGAARSRRTVPIKKVSTPSSGLMSGAVAMLTQGLNLQERGPIAAGRDLYIQTELVRLLHEVDVHVMLLSPEAASGAGLQRLIDSRPGALAATYSVAGSEAGRAILREVAGAGIPVVVNGSNPALADFDRVVSDHAFGSESLVRWLVSQGRRRILRFWRFTDQPDWLVHRDVGFNRASAELGLEVLAPVRTVDLPQGEHVKEEFHHVRRLLAGYLMEAFERDPGIDSIMVATDYHAFQVNAALRMIGKKPGEDVLVVGYDNLYEGHPVAQWESLGPAATVDKDNKQIAEAMARLLKGRVSGSLVDGPQSRTSIPRLVIPGYSSTKFQSQRADSGN